MNYTANPDAITREYFDSLLLETRYIDSVLPTTKMTLFGEEFDTPIMTAALSHLDKTAPNGMSVYAQGADFSHCVDESDAVEAADRMVGSNYISAVFFDMFQTFRYDTCVEFFHRFSNKRQSSHAVGSDQQSVYVVLMKNLL